MPASSSAQTSGFLNRNVFKYIFVSRRRFLDSIYYTEHLILKNLDPSWAPSVLNFYLINRSHFEPWEPLRPNNFYTSNHQRFVLAAEQQLFLNNQAVRYYLFEKSNTHKIIGSVNFYNIHKNPDNSCKIGYKLASSKLHKGYATEAISFLIPRIFHDYNLYRIEADIMKNNLPSIHLIEKLNFHLEGITRGGFEICGKREDHLKYSLIYTDI